VPGLAETGHDAAATTPPRLLRPRQQSIHGDVDDPATFSTPLAGCEAAWHLVHPQSDVDFSATMWRRRSVRRSGGAGRPDSIIYLRRLGLTTPTPCRHTCAAAARARSCSGAAGSRNCPARRESSSGTAASRRSWARQLVEHLPVMVTPKPVSTAPSPSPPTAPRGNSGPAPPSSACGTSTSPTLKPVSGPATSMSASSCRNAAGDRIAVRARLGAGLRQPASRRNLR
jgi:hypothetical protein